MDHPATVDPKQLFPFGHSQRHTVFLKPLLEEIDPPRANISVGDYSYYSDFDDATRFFLRNVRYDFARSKARLDIGKFCAFAHDTTFVMSDANHAIVGPSTFPFPIFGGVWAKALSADETPWANKGDTKIGHDVWCGYKSTIMPGVTVGSGAIVAANAVVSRDVPAYAMVAGNPARVVKMRFDDATIAKLLALAWWDWPAAKIAAAVPILVKGDVDALAALAP
jgi:virginiamycin A acetyltransferase